MTRRRIFAAHSFPWGGQCVSFASSLSPRRMADTTTHPLGVCSRPTRVSGLTSITTAGAEVCAFVHLLMLSIKHAWVSQAKQRTVEAMVAFTEKQRISLPLPLWLSLVGIIITGAGAWFVTQSKAALAAEESKANAAELRSQDKRVQFLENTVLPALSRIEARQEATDRKIDGLPQRKVGAK